jgi:hypothetical protein
MLRTDKDRTPTDVNLDPGYLATLSDKPWFALGPDERTTVIVAAACYKIRRPIKSHSSPGNVRVGKVFK